jgi:hypothetical protein
MEYKWGGGGSFLGWFIGLVVQEIFYSALAALVNPVQNIFFLAAHFFSLYVSHLPSKLGRQSVVPGRLSLINVSLLTMQATEYTQSGVCRFLAYIP